MSVVSIIQLSTLQRFKRMDAEYYQPLFLQYYANLRKLGSIKLGNADYAKVADGIHTAIDYDESSGIRCLSAQSVKKGYFDLSANAFISAKQHNKNLRTSLKAGDVMISCIGTVGNCAVVTDKILPANTDRNIGHVRTTGKLNPHFLCAFLLSKYGRFQTERESTGNVQKALFIDKMKEILVPILPQQDEIASKMRQARILMCNSETMFLKAQDTLLSFLGLPENLSSVNPLTYSASYKIVQQLCRIDAEYYQPKYEYVLNKIKEFKNGYYALVDKAPLSKGKINPKATPERKFAYVELASVNESFGTIDEYTVTSGKLAPSRARMLLRKGDVIASAVEGSLSKVALVSEQLDSAIGSTGFFVFRPKQEILSGYLLALVKSPLVQLQLQRESTGTVLASVPRKSAKGIIVPNIPKEKQEPIDSTVLESHKLRQQARMLIDEAINDVEIMIANALTQRTN